MLTASHRWLDAISQIHCKTGSIVPVTNVEFKDVYQVLFLSLGFLLNSLCFLHFFNCSKIKIPEFLLSEIYNPNTSLCGSYFSKA